MVNGGRYALRRRDGHYEIVRRDCGNAVVASLATAAQARRFVLERAVGLRRPTVDPLDDRDVFPHRARPA